jgi:hypothetical protein
MHTLVLSQTSPFASQGSRERALKIRDELRTMIELEGSATVDFANVHPTQSFVDELIGVLILENGPEVLSKLRFANCSRDVQSILHFVANDRIEDYERRIQESYRAQLQS